jgi:hypothetical protein
LTFETNNKCYIFILLLCSKCPYYLPRTLDGKRDVLMQIKKQYEVKLEELQTEIKDIERELTKNSIDS